MTYTSSCLLRSLALRGLAAVRRDVVRLDVLDVILLVDRDRPVLRLLDVLPEEAEVLFLGQVGPQFVVCGFETGAFSGPEAVAHVDR